MDNSLRVMQSACTFLLTASALLFVDFTAANAASYTYTLSDVGSLTGTITTSCNNCVLNASNITAFNLSEAGLISVSSTTGSKLVLTGNAADMVADGCTLDDTFINMN